jgi:hypothetical protein
MKLKLPAHVLFHQDLRLIVWRPRGLLNEAAVNKIVEFLGTLEATSSKPFNRFTDTLSVDAVDLTLKYIFHVSLFRRLSYAGRPPVKSAILVTSKTIAQYSKVHALLTQGSPIKVRIFEVRDEAAKWLGVSKETLEY